MGPAAQHQPHLWRDYASRLHDEGRRAGHANGPAPARCATRRDLRVLPGTSLVRRNDTHRLIPSKYTEDGSSVLARIANDDMHLADVFELDNATNDRLLAEHERLPGIGVHELLFGVRYYRIVNAAFNHAHPLGSRVNGPDRG